MIKEEFKKHKLAYGILVLGLIVLGLLFMLAWPNHFYQRWVAAAISVFYFFWGLSTHFKSDHITLQVVLEYLFISTLAGLLLFLVTI